MARQARRRSRTSVGVESLEGRQVPSTAIGLAIPVGVALTHWISSIDLQGTAKGVTLRQVGGNPDVGSTVGLWGSGTIPSLGLGRATVTGTLHGTGFLASGHVEGTITLANGRGSLTVHLQGPTETGFSPPSSGAYSFSVVRGTGAFAHDFGEGTVALTLGPRSFSMAWHGKPNGN